MLGIPKKKERTLAVEIDTTSFKWAVFKGRASGAEVLDIGAFSIAVSGDVINQKLLEIIRRYKIEPSAVVGCLPRNQVTARNLELPSTDPAEIKQMFEIQAAKQTPYAADQILSDYYLIDTAHVDYSHIMLVVAHRQAVNEHLRILQEAGLKPQSVSLSTADSSQWIMHELHPSGRKTTDTEIAVVLDVDAEDTDFFVHGRGQLLFTQTISIGADKLAHDPVQWREKFLSEVARSMEIFRAAEVAKDISLFIFTGSFEVLRPMLVPLQTIVGHVPRELPLPDFVQKIFNKDENEVSWMKGQSFTSVMGLAYRDKEPPINLVPQEVLIQSALVEKGRDVLVMGVLVLLLALTAVGFFGWRYYLKQSHLEWLEKEVKATEQDAQAVESTRMLVKEIMRLNSLSADFFRDMIHVANSMPREIYLTELNLNKDRMLDMRGRSERMTSVFDFVNQLKARPTFRDVETRQLNKRIVDNKEVVDFEIHCRLSEQ